MKGFPEALAAVLASEGGFVDHPADRGGPTNMGVTQGVFDAHRRSRGLPSRSVRDISTAEVAEIYMARYWTPAKCGALPWPASLCHFDAAVNSGVRQAAVLLQRAVGVAEDGVIGPQTLAAVQRAGRARLLARMWVGRLDLYRRIVAGNPTQLVFLRGWENRVADLIERCVGELAG